MQDLLNASNLANPVTGRNGALRYAGTGTGTCNCSTPVNNYYKNFGPRVGLAYLLDSKTVIRASYGVMFTHGDAVGGLASSIGTLGFSSAPSFSSSKSQTTMKNFLAGGTGTIQNYSVASGISSGPADRRERTVSTSNQPHHFVTTTVWKWPFGKTILAENAMERAIMGGFSFSGIFQAYSGSPLMITMSSCNCNPANASSNFCPPSYNSAFTGPARIDGKWGNGVTLANYNSTSFIDSNAFVKTLDYYFGNVPRTAPYNINGPGNYQLDLGMSRSFPLHLGESSKLDFRAEWYNVTNHTLFGVASTAWGNSNFGKVSNNASANRKAAQFSARISY